MNGVLIRAPKAIGDLRVGVRDTLEEGIEAGR